LPSLHDQDIAAIRAAIAAHGLEPDDFALQEGPTRRLGPEGCQLVGTVSATYLPTKIWREYARDCGTSWADLFELDLARRTFLR
jgi:hypothetical protein